MRKHVKRGHFTLLLPLSIMLAVVLTLWNPFSFSLSAPIGESDSQTRTLKHYGYYFVEDPGKNQAYVHEVKDFANVINMRYDNGPNNSWDPNTAKRVKDSGVKVMLQVPFGSDWDQTLFVDGAARDAYLNKVKQDMQDTGFMSSLAYIAISEEWYVLINQGFFDKWPIFQGKTKEEKFATAKHYLEQIIKDVKNTFPGIPTVIVENILPYPTPPSNVDVLGVDAYYIPDHEYCSEDQRDKFNREVLPYFDSAKPYNKPIMMVPPSFIGGPWKMLSQCQMEWYVDLAVNGPYNIESLIWFFYADTSGFIGVRNFPGLVFYQKSVSCEILGKCSGTPTPTPTPTPTSTPPPSGQVTYKINLQADNCQYVVAEGNGGGAVNANRDQAWAWETFTVTDLNGGQLVSGDKVGISTETNYYFRAVSGGGSTLDATSRSFGSSETFTILRSGGGTIANGDKINLQTSNNTHYMVAESGGGREVAANRNWAWAWETFTLKVLSQTTPTPAPTPTPTATPTPTPSGPTSYIINLQANNGQYVVAEKNGGEWVNANRNNAGGWETFTMTDLNGGQLMSGDKVGFNTSSDYYFRAEGGGGSTLDATARGLGPWETFTIRNTNSGSSIKNGDKISIGTWNGTHYLVAEGGGGREVAANRTAAWAWETFTIIIK